MFIITRPESSGEHATPTRGHRRPAIDRLVAYLGRSAATERYYIQDAWLQHWLIQQEIFSCFPIIQKTLKVKISPSSVLLPLPGDSITVSAQVTNPLPAPATDVSLGLQAPTGWTATPASTGPATLTPGDSGSWAWQITAPATATPGLYHPVGPHAALHLRQPVRLTSTFAAVQTTALRILILGSNDHTYSRLLEVERSPTRRCSVASCPDELLLFFHHVSCTHRPHSGDTVIEHIYDRHFTGLDEAVGRATWRKLRRWIDDERYADEADIAGLRDYDVQVSSGGAWTTVAQMRGLHRADGRGRRTHAGPRRRGRRVSGHSVSIRHARGPFLDRKGPLTC